MRKSLVAALAMLAGIAAAHAQSYPTRPITAIVPASAGGPTDTIAPHRDGARAADARADDRHREHRRRVGHDRDRPRRARRSATATR